MVALNRSALAVLAALLVSGCSGIATKQIEAERTELRSKPVEMNAAGNPKASIDASGSVRIGSGVLALTDTQRTLALLYRDAVVDLVDLSLKDASRLTSHVVTRTLFGMATGRLEKTEKSIERQAEGIAHTPEFCGLLEEARERQDRMLQSMVELKPYAGVSQQDVDDCAAGRPYETGAWTAPSSILDEVGNKADVGRLRARIDGARDRPPGRVPAGCHHHRGDLRLSSTWSKSWNDVVNAGGQS
jgi:hypothetical protein